MMGASSGMGGSILLEVDRMLIDAIMFSHNTKVEAALEDCTALIASPDKADRQLFQDSWDALSSQWQDPHQNLYMQFIQEVWGNPVIGSHTTTAQHDSVIHDSLVEW